MNYTYQNDLAAVYESVINDVIDSCREMFADERVDETVLDDLKTAWRQRMMDAGALPSAASRAAQHNAVYMQGVAHKGQHNLIAGQVGAGGSRASMQQAQQLTNLQPMVLGQQRLPGNTHVLSQAAYLAQSTLRSQQLKPSDVVGIPGGQTLLQQAPQPGARGTNVISAVIVPVPKSTTGAGSDMKTPPTNMRRVQLDGRYDGQASSSGAASGAGRGASSREPPEKRFARSGLAGPVSDESDLSDSDIGNLDEFAAVGEEGGLPAGPNDDEDPLNSGDDVSEAEEDVFDCPDLLVCQYDKVNRAKAKWRFSFRDAILQCGSSRREYLFSRITGEAEFS